MAKRRSFRISVPLAARGDLSEQEIRTALIQSFAQRTAVFEEFPVSGGRLDLLTVSGPHLAGFEIKSDFDTLRRVNEQVAVFSLYCDTLTFVAGRRSALALLRDLPVWCGVSLAYRRTSRQIRIFTLRHPRPNPLVCAAASISLLRRDEMLAIVSRQAYAHTNRKNLQRVLLTHSFGNLRACLSAALMRRAGTRFDALRGLGGGLFLPEAT